jgi:hypothetical protein
VTADIEAARDILTQRRQATSARQGVAMPVTAAPGDAALIQIMVNRDMLDALDELLTAADEIDASPAERNWAERIAAAIITANEGLTT